MSEFPIPRSDILFDCIYDLDCSEAEWIEAIIQALGPLIGVKDRASAVDMARFLSLIAPEES